MQLLLVLPLLVLLLLVELFLQVCLYFLADKKGLLYM